MYFLFNFYGFQAEKMVEIWVELNSFWDNEFIKRHLFIILQGGESLGTYSWHTSLFIFAVSVYK